MTASKQGPGLHLPCTSPRDKRGPETLDIQGRAWLRSRLLTGGLQVRVLLEEPFILARSRLIICPSALTKICS